MENKKLVQINTVCNTSTGRIMHAIQKKASEQGFETLSFVGRRKVFTDLPCEKYGNPISFWVHVAINTIFDRQGYGSWYATKRLIKRLKKEQPDIIHLHNLHGYYLNLPILFDYLKREFKGQLFWTFHDCWPFTGHCAYFTMAGCDKWKEQCENCQNKKNYPVSLLLDASKRNYKDKKNLFCNLENLTILTPSCFMEKLIKNSFMKAYTIKVIPNGIDLKEFSYRINENIYKKYKIPYDKKILLGVANVWDKRKGLEDFLGLAREVHGEYKIVLVGLNKWQIKGLPTNIVGVERTENIEELVNLYSIADIFINPSLEESFSMVTVEALACGTPVIVLDTSAVKELVTAENGIVLSSHEISDYLSAIEKIESMKLKRAQVALTAKPYDMQEVLDRIIDLYKERT